MPDILKKKFGVDITHENIIPEFPVKKEENNQSFKIDYVAVCNKTNKVFFIELKTDDYSRNIEQDENLIKAKNKTIAKLVEDIHTISKHSDSKKKYQNLLGLLAKIGWSDVTKIPNYDIEIVYIQPNVEGVITFHEIVNYLSDKDDNATQRFVQSLKRWVVNPNNE